MKADRPVRTRFRDDDEGVSVVLGAILIAGLLVTVLATVQLNHVPVWVEQAEAEHAESLVGQLAAMKGEVDRQTGNRSAIPVTHPFTMQRDRVNLLDSGRLPARMTFESEGTTAASLSALGPVVTSTDFTIKSNKMLIIERNGQAVASTDEDAWEEIGATDSVTNISETFSLRLRIDSVSNDHDGDWLEIRCTDADGGGCGIFRVYVVEHPSGYDVNVRVTDAAGNVLYDQGDAYFLQDPRSPYWVDTFANEYRWEPLLQKAKVPYRLDMVESGLTGDFLISYSEAIVTDDGTESLLVASAGELQDDFSDTIDGGGRFIVDTRYSHHPQQRFVYENGAVILDQLDGEVMKIAPHFSARLVGDILTLDITSPVLDGDDRTVQGADTITVQTDTQRASSLLAFAPRFSVNYTTAYPTVWTDHWSERLDAAGLSIGLGEYAVSSGANWANVTVYGKTTAVASEEYDLLVGFATGEVRTRIVV